MRGMKEAAIMNDKKRTRDQSKADFYFGGFVSVAVAVFCETGKRIVIQV